MGGGPGAVGHDQVDGAAHAAVKAGEQMPVSFFEEAAETFARAGVEAFAKGGSGVKGAEHVGGNGRVVDVGSGGNGGEEEFGECEGEGVAHGIDEDIGDEKRKGIVR